MHFIETYADWTVDLWSSRSSVALSVRDMAVMSLGLPEENSEVLEVVLPAFDGAPFDLTAFRKEMGDLIYYWARLCRAFGLSPSKLWPQEASLEPRRSLGSVTRHLTLECGRVAGVCKKHVRDDVLHEVLLETAMAGVAREWLALCRHFGEEEQDILQVNRVKVEDRKARKVLHGRGDSR